MASVGDIMRGEAERYLESRYVTPVQRKAIYDIACCRTASMGTVTEACEHCGVEYRLFRSCRNRSCPLCGSDARRKWLEARIEELLPVEYLQVVFTPPSELNVIGRYCPEAFYDALIRAAGQAVIDVGWSKLHIEVGCLTQLHTWAQTMAYHPHAHCMVPCGGFSEEGSRWVSFEPEDLPVRSLSRRFRSLLCERLRVAARQKKLTALPPTVSVAQLLARVEKRQWRVYAKPPFGGAEALLEYLSRYACRIAITNERIQWYENDQVSFRCRRNSCTLAGQEFVRRFLMHVPPRRFVRIRSYGLLSNRGRKERIEQARKVIGQAQHEESSAQRFRPLRLCPACWARMGNGRRPHFAPSPEILPQLVLNLRPPPTPSLAA